MLTVNAFATFVAVLETGADGIAKDSVPLLDRQYLTNVLREQAVKELPAKENFTIMTRENILQMQRDIGAAGRGLPHRRDADVPVLLLRLSRKKLQQRDPELHETTPFCSITFA